VWVIYRGKGSRAFINGAGRAMNFKKGKGILFSPDQTNACVSGFLVNMVERCIRLISPCVPDSQWPLGYMVLDTLNFSDAADFRKCLEEMIDRHMPVTFPDDRPLRFRPDLEFKELRDGFEVSTRYMTRRFGKEPYVKDLGKIILQGTRTVNEAISMLTFYAVPPAMSRRALKLMFEQGVLDESPLDRRGRE